MADTITVKQLADQAGVKPSVLRRILRSRFPREAKGKSYSWQPDDPQIELIIKAVKNHKAETTTQPAAKAETPQAEKPTTKPAPKPVAKKATKSETGA